jgi:hypothetical protein
MFYKPDVIAVPMSRLRRPESGRFATPWAAGATIKFNQESRLSVTFAFGMGAVAALLVGACVAPVVILVVVFASDMYTQGSEPRSRSHSSSGWEWRFPGQSPARASRRCPSQVRGCCASSRLWASSSWSRLCTTAMQPTEASRCDGWTRRR